MQILSRLKQRKWQRFIPVITVLLGFASCDVCGGSFRGDGTSFCSQFNMVSATGFPYGPVTVVWTPTEHMDQYWIWITDSNGTVLGQSIVTPDQTSTTVTLDHTLADKAMALDGIFNITGIGSLDNTSGVGECEFDSTVSLKKQQHKAPPQPAAPPTPVKIVPTAEPTLKPTATLFIIPIPHRPTATLAVPR